METKALIRKKALAVRDRLPSEEQSEKSRRITEQLMQLAVYKEANRILTYVNYRSEVETDLLIKEALQEGKQIYCPRVTGNEMEFYRIFSMDELETGYKGIKEPLPEKDRLLSEDAIKKGKCLMLMPGSAFDTERNRLGYGGGYYDRYLDSHPEMPKVALCFSCQIQDGIPAEPHDRQPDMIITEERIYR